MSQINLGFSKVLLRVFVLQGCLRILELLLSFN